MNKNTKIILGIVCVLVIIGGIFFVRENGMRHTVLLGSDVSGLNFRNAQYTFQLKNSDGTSYAKTLHLSDPMQNGQIAAGTCGNGGDQGLVLAVSPADTYVVVAVDCRFTANANDEYLAVFKNIKSNPIQVGAVNVRDADALAFARKDGYIVSILDVRFSDANTLTASTVTTPVDPSDAGKYQGMPTGTVPANYTLTDQGELQAAN